MEVSAAVVEVSAAVEAPGAVDSAIAGISRENRKFRSIRKKCALLRDRFRHEKSLDNKAE